MRSMRDWLSVPRGHMMIDARFSFTEIAGITGGRWLWGSSGGSRGDRVVGVWDDSRAVRSGGLFVAIAGELADGHGFIPQAVKAGAAAVCIREEPERKTRELLVSAGVACLKAGDTLRAFQRLATAQRRRISPLTVIGITGSCGKTSTKEMIAAVLAREWPERVLKTQGNTNNHFGVPRNLLRLERHHRAAVIEMGSNHPGEIMRLAEIAEPDVGVVSHVGRAHLEFFGDLSGVAREKGDILAGTAPSGTAVFPGEAPHGEVLRAKAGSRKVLTFGTEEGNDVRIRYGGGEATGMYSVTASVPRTGQRQSFSWRIGGEHQALNAGAAIAVGVGAGMDLGEIVEGLRTCCLPKMRMEIRDVAGVRWVNDAYNANPDSMRAALNWFAETGRDESDGDRLLVLGDMLEMGDWGAAAHADLLAWAARRFGRGHLVVVGPLMCAAAASAGVCGFADAEGAAEEIRGRIRPGMRVLLKGSRGIGLERVLETWRESLDGPVC